MKTKKTSVDVYQIITDQIIAKLEQGIIPWKQPWSCIPPTNYVTQKPYRGINHLLLGMNAVEQPYYLTFKQASELGGRIRKGAKSEIVVFWQMRYFDSVQKGWKSLTPGEKQPSEGVVPLLRYYRVFNVADVEGIDFKFPMATPVGIEDDLSLDSLETGYEPLRRLPGLSLVTLCSGASYSPSKDTVYMPSYQNFLSTSVYFQTLYHEACHATGHQSRLAREGITKPVNFESERYRKEELIAELGACFLMSRKGFTITNNLDNSAAYIQSWLKNLRDDKKLIIEAAGKAQKAVDFIYPTEVTAGEG